MSRIAFLTARSGTGRAWRAALGTGVATLALTATLAPSTPPAGLPAPAAIAATLGPALLDPRPVLATLPAERVPAGLRRMAGSPPARVAALPMPSRDPESTGSLPPPTLAVAAATPALPPLPVPRPPEFREVAQIQPAARTPARPRREKQAMLPAGAQEPSFFEKLFGIAPEPTYAALNTGPVPAAPAPRISPAPGPAAEGGVAFYDIAARTVTLPSGERLEAHSGLGEKLDDPRHVHLRMRGATPPGTYDLTERETPFHGVRAIRLNPVGGAGAVFGRSGLLAHTYMLGPNGDSNGCVSVRDYDRFLQAFLRGEIRRLVVVAGRGFDAAPGGPRIGRAGAADPSRG